MTPPSAPVRAPTPQAPFTRKVVAAWYRNDLSTVTQNSNPFSAAKEAYQEGIAVFAQRLTKDISKQQQAAHYQSVSINDVVELVNQARKTYEKRRDSSRVRECVASFAQRICHYGNVLDVFVQHHPEYVSLAWGATKLVFGAIVEHEKTGTTVVQALCEVADALPRLELAAVLYPTDAMKRAVASLYAHIIRFLIRALNWYEEGTLLRVVHSITRPVALRYADVIADIQKDTASIEKLSSSCSQAEQRDMHYELLITRATAEAIRVEGSQERLQMQKQLATLADLVQNLQATITQQQKLSQQSWLSVDDKLTDIQMSQSLQLLSNHCTIHHTAILSRLILVGKCRKLQTDKRLTPFWNTPTMGAWNTSLNTSAVLVRGTYRQKGPLSNFCVNAIEQLDRSSTVVLHVLRDSSQPYALLEVLKSLAYQAIRHSRSTPTASTVHFIHQKFTNASDAEDFVNLLGEHLADHRLIYIIVNADVMDAAASLECRRLLRSLGQKLAERGVPTVLRVLVISCNAAGLADMVEDACLRAGTLRAGNKMQQTRGSRSLGMRRGGRFAAPQRSRTGT